MSGEPHPLLRRAVGLAKPALVGVLAFVAVSSTISTSTASDAAAGAATGVTDVREVAQPAGQVRLDRLTSRHDCSPTGFGADVIPGSSLVLQDDRVRHVSFDDGWAVYTGAEAGTLLAVCRATR